MGILLCNISNTLLAQSEGETFNEAKELLKKATNTLDIMLLEKAEGMFNDLAEKNPKDYLYPYYLGETCSQMVNYYLSKQDMEKGGKVNERGIKYTEHSISLKEDFADSHRLLGELYGKIIAFDAASAMEYGPLSIEEYERAIELDPKNYLAYNGIAIGKLYTPEPYGGGADVALEYLLKAKEINPDFYQTYIWLGMAYKMKNDLVNAEKSYKKALELEPENEWVKMIWKEFKTPKKE